MKDIREVPDDGLEAAIKRYRERGLTVGGPFSLAELLLEQKRRSKSEFYGRTVVEAIMYAARGSESCYTTYRDLHEQLYPGEPWKGNYSRSLMMQALDKAIHYCVGTKLPILSVLVVRSDDRKLSEQAIQNIYNECKEMGLDVGLEPEKFVSEQIALSKEWVRETSASAVKENKQ
jgi:hypothetical protein